GHCRKQCKDGEAVKETCKNHRACCVPSKKLTVPRVTLNGIILWSHPRPGSTEPQKRKEIHGG
uniref:Beta-defensin n=1 Tax=Macaca mulatta TaxID=9544 RepID=A0A5F7ZR45_MACMU